MHKIERFTVRHPLFFGFLLILLYINLSILTWPITQIYPHPEYYEVGTALAKLVIAAILLLLLWALGWLKNAGIASPGRKPYWIWVAVLGIYNLLFGIYAFTGSLQMGLPSLGFTLAILFFSFTTGLMEEILYRGLLLTAMIKAWGTTRRGLFAAALISGLFFASNHFVNLLNNPFPVVALQVLGMTMVGFMYAVIVMSGKSIWPAVVCHWVVNASVGLQVCQINNFEETTTAWLIYSLSLIPMVVVFQSLLRHRTLETRSTNATPPSDTPKLELSVDLIQKGK
jgi:membrane protease YdiL (CAAX protease family)